MLKSISAYVLVSACFFSFAIFSSYTQSDQPSETLALNSERLPQKIESVNLNSSFDFAGEALPMENFDVKERLDRELLRNAYWHSNTVLAIKRAYRYFPVIERILAENGIPNDFKYLAVAESDLTNAVSPAGAKGIWQFMKGTGREYNLKIDNEVDERYHLEKATKAACKYLKQKKEKFGNWTLAAAAYNMGANGLSKDMKVQRGASYYDLNLNQETMRYVFRIVALKEIMNHPEKYGFNISDKDKYDPLNFIHVKVDSAIPNWGDFAKDNGISYRMLKVYNPWLISSSLTNKEKQEYFIKVPKMGK